MGDVELLIGLLAGIVAVVLLARRLRLPYPILLVLAGVAMSLVPGLTARPTPTRSSACAASTRCAWRGSDRTRRTPAAGCAWS
jgi:hypothetical protein